MLLSGVCVNIDGSEVVWRSQPRARSSISRYVYVLDAGYSELEDGHVHCLKDGGVVEDAREARYR